MGEVAILEDSSEEFPKHTISELNSIGDVIEYWKKKGCSLGMGKMQPAG